MSFDNNENSNDFSIDETSFKRKKLSNASRSQRFENQSIIDIDDSSLFFDRQLTSTFNFSLIINSSTTNFRRHINFTSSKSNINNMFEQQLNSIIQIIVNRMIQIAIQVYVVNFSSSQRNEREKRDESKKSKKSKINDNFDCHEKQFVVRSINASSNLSLVLRMKS